MTTGARNWVLAMAAVALIAQPVQAEGLRFGEGREKAAGLSAIGLARVDSTIEAAIRDRATPGAALAIGRHGELVRLRGYGRLGWSDFDEPVSDSSIYDIASLTKVVGTTSAIMILVERGQLELDAPIHHFLPAWPRTGEHARITLRHLLTHTSGLPAGANLWTTTGRNEKIERIANMRLATAPGVATNYSDLGMIVAAALVEAVTNERLDAFLYREVFEPMGMTETRFNPRAFVADAQAVTNAPPLLTQPTTSAFFEPFRLLAAWTPAAKPQHLRLPTQRIAPTEAGVPRGYVHDRNAAAFEGVTGHAGLFSSVRDLAVFAETMLNALHGEDTPIVSAKTVQLFLQRSPNGQRALGWDVAKGRSSAGEYFTISAVGHTGFTGTSIWIDPERDLYVVLLTNRLHPSASNKKHVAMRRDVHDAVQLAIDDQLVVARSD